MADQAQLSASLLAADFGRMRSDLQRAEAAGVHRFHFDFMDGHYVPNLALTPQHIKALRPFSRLPFDVHLELANPEQVLEFFAWEGVSTLIFQADTISDNSQLFKKARSLGLRVGLSVNPDESIAPLKGLFSEIDHFLVLGVQPGFGGQSMHPGTPDRMREVRELAGNGNLEISVDGGVNLQNAGDLIAAGADVLVAGTAIFGAENITETIKAFSDALNKA